MPGLEAVFDRACVAVDVVAACKRDAITALVDLLASAGKAPDRDALIRAVMEREALAPTGLGDDCAIPHAQDDSAPETAVAAIRLAEPMDFGAPDGTPARLVFLIVGPKDSAAAHLRLLSRLARVLCDDDFRSSALAAPDAGSFALAILRTDNPPATCA
ncbi:MAG: PTS sugar transporter subunit IIA [Spirochaetes bacterium]|nr:PTS sugar transporter subunit IIA [Spirochaetota bacterium]